MGSRGNEELSTGAEVVWLPTGGQLHLQGSQTVTVMCLTSCPFSSLTAAPADWGEGTMSCLQWTGWLWSLCPVAAYLDLLPSVEPAVRERLGRSPALEMLQEG